MSAPTASTPLFTVVVATCGRAEPLRACLEGLAALDFPREQFEVVVSDDGSPTPVEPVVAPFRDRLQLTLVTHPNTGPAGARNRGAARALGAYLAFIDDDCVPALDWLARLASQLARAPDHLIGGRIVNALPENPFSTATHFAMTYAYDYDDRRRAGARFFGTGNLAVPAARFRKLGGFNDVFGRLAAEDYDLCHRWQHAGHGVTYAPEAVVHHAHALTLAGFWRQHFRYGRGLFRCRRQIAERTRRPLRGEPLSFYLGLLRFPLRCGRGARAWLHALLVALSQAATAAGALREALAEGWRAVRSRRPAGSRGAAKVRV